MYVCIYMYIHIYIYIERERDQREREIRERERGRPFPGRLAARPPGCPATIIYVNTNIDNNSSNNNNSDVNIFRSMNIHNSITDDANHSNITIQLPSCLAARHPDPSSSPLYCILFQYIPIVFYSLYSYSQFIPTVFLLYSFQYVLSRCPATWQPDRLRFQARVWLTDLGSSSLFFCLRGGTEQRHQQSQTTIGKCILTWCLSAWLPPARKKRPARLG